MSVGVVREALLFVGHVKDCFRSGTIMELVLDHQSLKTLTFLFWAHVDIKTHFCGQFQSSVCSGLPTTTHLALRLTCNHASTTK